MRSLVRFLLALLALWRVTRRPIGLPRDLEWTPRDSSVLASFLATDTGKRLEAQLLGQVAAANERAAQSDGKAVACGQAQGMRTFFQALKYFAEVPADEDQLATSGGTAPDLAHLAP